MDFLFRALGHIAQISTKMSRFRLDFIPSNWILVAACLFAALWMLRAFGFLGLPFALVFLVVAGAFGFVAAQNCAVFRPQRGGSFPSSGSRDLDLKVSGAWILDAHRRFFAEVPANFDLKSDGSRQFCAQIQLSASFFGVPVAAQNGEWKISVPPGQNPEIVPGALYTSPTPRPALRLRWPENGRTQSVILSFGDGPQRAQFLTLWRQSIN